MESLQDLFEHELKDIYHAEKQLLKALPKMAKGAMSDKLRQGFEEHLEQTQTHVERLEEVFSLMDVAARGKRCEAMEGLIEEGSTILQEEEESDVRDAALIAAAQKVEHYEIASYGTLCTYAEMLGLSEAKELLGQTLTEEKETDEKLTMLAESEVNTAALAEAEE
jgi:ferritin-like metal-binding protein YciE